MPARLICAAVVLALSMAPGAAWASCPRAPAADTGPVGAGTPRVAALEALREGAQACGPAAPQECTFQAGGITYQLCLLYTSRCV